MEPDADKTKVVAMLLHLRDSLTEMSLMLKDYHANLDVIHNGPATKQTSESLDAVLLDARRASNLERSREQRYINFMTSPTSLGLSKPGKSV
jgi:hypothetical protein